MVIGSLDAEHVTAGRQSRQAPERQPIIKQGQTGSQHLEIDRMAGYSVRETALSFLVSG